MGNVQKIELNGIKYQSFETNSKKENEIDKTKEQTLKIDKFFVNNALKVNNDYRIKHGTNPLKLDDYLNKKACILAKEFLTKGEFENVDLLYTNYEELGMNVKLSNKKLDAEILMKKWYEENTDYKYQNPQELDCNNFTQMIWKKSTKLGIGYYHLNEQDRKKMIKKSDNIQNGIEDTKKKEYEFCYIALYYPAGNIPGEYKDNVNQEYKIIESADNDIVIIRKEVVPEYPDFDEVNNQNTNGNS